MIPVLDTIATRAENVRDRKSTRLNSSHANISYAVFCLKKTKLQFSPAHTSSGGFGLTRGPRWFAQELLRFQSLWLANLRQYLYASRHERLCRGFHQHRR